MSTDYSIRPLLQQAFHPVQGQKIDKKIPINIGLDLGIIFKPFKVMGEFNINQKEPITRRRYFKLMREQFEKKLPYVLVANQQYDNRKVTEYFQYFLDGDSLHNWNKSGQLTNPCTGKPLQERLYFVINNENENFQFLFKIASSASYPVSFIYQFLEACKGNVNSQINVARYYAEGKVVTKNPNEELQWRERAASQGYPELQLQLAYMYSRGTHGVKVNLEKAFEWFLKAAKGGNAQAQHEVSLCHRNGRGCEKNLPLAFETCHRAALQHFTLAQFEVGIKYFFGEGVEKNWGLAFEWMKTSAENGHVASEYLLGHFYENEVGTEKDLSRAFNCYKNAAERSSTAQLALGRCYECGIGTEIDLKNAFDCYERAARFDNEARNKVAQFYREGIVVSQNYTLALNWLQKSADDQNAEAQFVLGEMHARGEGVQADPEVAFSWYEKSALNGLEKAQLKVAYCYLTGLGILKSRAKSLEWYLKTKIENHAQRQHALGVMYQTGTILRKDIERASKHFGKAAALGYRETSSAINAK